jgi:hypothetical protein
MALEPPPLLLPATAASIAKPEPDWSSGGINLTDER